MLMPYGLLSSRMAFVVTGDVAWMIRVKEQCEIIMPAPNYK